MGGLTIENNFFILKIEKRNKIIVFDLFLSRDFAYIYAVFVALYWSALVKIPHSSYDFHSVQRMYLLSEPRPSFPLIYPL